LTRCFKSRPRRSNFHTTKVFPDSRIKILFDSDLEDLYALPVLDDENHKELFTIEETDKIIYYIDIALKKLQSILQSWINACDDGKGPLDKCQILQNLFKANIRTT